MSEEGRGGTMTDRLLQLIVAEQKVQGKQLAKQGEQLATQGEQLAKLTGKVGQIGKRIDKQGKQLAKQGKQLAKQGKQLAKLTGKVGQIGKRIDKLERDTETLNATVTRGFSKQQGTLSKILDLIGKTKWFREPEREGTEQAVAHRRLPQRRLRDSEEGGAEQEAFQTETGRNKAG